MSRGALAAIATAVIGLMVTGCAAGHTAPRGRRVPQSAARVPQSAARVPQPAARVPQPDRSADPTPGLLDTSPVPAASLPVAVPSRRSVNFDDPTAVSLAAVVTEWTMDTVTDASQYQAELRSAPFLSPGYLAELKTAPPVAAPGYQWDQWTTHRAYTTVAAVAEPDDQPADTPTTADRQWGITVTPHGAGGWTGTPLTATVFVQLTRVGPGQPWLVAGMLVDS